PTPVKTSAKRVAATPKSESSPSFLEEISDEAAEAFSQKYGFSLETVRREAAKCANHHLSRGTKIKDYSRAFHTWLSSGYVKEEKASVDKNLFFDNDGKEITEDEWMKLMGFGDSP